MAGVNIAGTCSELVAPFDAEEDVVDFDAEGDVVDFDAEGGVVDCDAARDVVAAPCDAARGVVDVVRRPCAMAVNHLVKAWESKSLVYNSCCVSVATTTRRELQ